VLLRWCLQHDLPLIPKSTHRERIHENAQILETVARICRILANSDIELAARHGRKPW
jgi:diketogulonate reductase-like aldo/keto reductase